MSAAIPTRDRPHAHPGRPVHGRRYSVMYGAVHGPLAEGDREVLAELHSRYAMSPNPQAGPPPAGALTPQFIDRFAVVGPPQRCVERLQQVLAIGIDKVLINGGGMPDRDATRKAAHLLATEVLPALRDSPL